MPTPVPPSSRAVSRRPLAGARDQPLAVADPSPVTIGIVNHNDAEHLLRTLTAVSVLGPEVREVLLVDNGSTDGGPALARQTLPGLRVIELGANLGPAAARNVIAREASCDRILLIDNDVAPEEGCLEALSAALDANPRAAIAMPAVLHAREPDTVQYVGAEAHFLGAMAFRGAGRPASTLGGRVHVVGSLVSACLLLDRRRLGARPLFEEELFIYYEDHELGLRCRLMGFDVLAVEGARCLHGDGTAGLSVRRTGRFTPTRVRHTIRNRWYTILKLYEGKTLLRFAPTLAAFEVLQLAGAVRLGWFPHWMWAARWIVGNLPEVLRKREEFAGLRRRRDLDVLVGGPFPFNPALPMGRAGRWSRQALDAVGRLNWRLLGSRR